MDALDELTHWFWNSSVGLGQLDLNLRFVRMNERLATFIGQPADNQIGRTLEEVFPDISAQAAPSIRQVIDSKTAVLDVEVTGPMPAEPGMQKYWLASYYPLKDQDGTVGQIVVGFQDITTSKRTDEKLRLTQEYLSTILANLPVGVAILEGPNFRYARLNSKLADINGLSVGDHLDRPLAEVLPEAAPSIVPELQRVLSTGEPRPNREFSTTLPNEPNVMRHFIDSFFPIVGRDGKAMAVGVAVFEITERKQAEVALQKAHAVLEQRVEERVLELADANSALQQEITDRKEIEESLRKSEARLANIIDIAADAIISIDVTQRIILFNKAAEQIFGYSADDILGQKLDRLLPPRLRAIHPGRIADFVRSATPARRMGERVPVSGRRSNGDEFPAEAAISKIEVGGEYVVTVILRDVTDRMQIEETLRQKRGELAHVLRTATMGELTTALAHEINQPLTAIMMNAQAARRLMRADALDFHEFSDILDDIIDDNRRAAEVIRHMRALLRKQELDSQLLDIGEIIGEVIGLIHSDAVIKSVEVNWDLAEDMPPVHGDRVQLQQVLLNLILNGFDAMQKVPAHERQMVIRTELRGKSAICVSVQDSGDGFAAHDAERLFEAFHTTKADGLGMGLAINQSIIAAHGGKIWALNNRDKGATFLFTLPIESNE